MKLTTSKFDSLVDRLNRKIGMSQTPVPGFILGLSGTDSIVAFMICYLALERHRKAHRLLGVHYVNAKRRRPSKFETDSISWLRERFPKATLRVETPLGGNQDQQRWADLHLRALNDVEIEAGCISPREQGENYWVAGTINATEHALGKYSLLAASASIQPIRTMWKSEVLAICTAVGVPQSAIDAARIPDCLCGRDELAAENIELIDDIVRLTVKPAEHPPELLEKLFAYVRDQKRENDFRSRLPYTI
jgi:NH3-dependent NAD+ synthetase